MIYTYETRSRRPAAFLTVIGVAVSILVLYLAIDLALIFVVILLLSLLPACWDIIQNTHATLDVSVGRIMWTSTIGNGDCADINHVRLTRRLDGSLKISLVHLDGSRTRLPPVISPPIRPFEDALQRADLRSERHPFSMS